MTANSYDVCIESPYLIKGDLPSYTALVPNCKYYEATIINENISNYHYKCAECKLSYILDTTNESCVPLSSYPRCRISNLITNTC